MKEHVDHGAPPTQLAQANERAPSDATTSSIAQIDTNLANLDAAAADVGRAGVPVLGADRLLDPRFDIAADARGFAQDADPAFPSFHDDDLPTPLFHDDDLPGPVFHDDDLPAPLLHEHDFPADLTTVGLSELLGLELGGEARPTVGEVVQTAFRRASPRKADPEDEEKSEEEKEQDADSDAENTDAEPQDSNSDISEAGDLSFIDAQSLTDKAETNNADAASNDEEVAELLGLGLQLFGSGTASDVGLGGFSDFSAAPAPAEAEGGGGSSGGSGGGTNVINGTAGDDVLNGTAGTDIIHGMAGDDVIDGGAGSDRLDGGQGDDVLVWDSADVKVDGKNGSDTLRVDGGDIDLTTFGGTLSGLENVDLLSDAGANAITLTAQDVLDATDNGNTLTITGDSSDSLDASNGWTHTGVDGSGNDIYTQAVGPKTATLAVDPDISVNANILM